MGQDTMRLAGEPTRIPVAGELSPWVDEFRRVLTEGGFTRHTVTTHTHLIADLSDWLTRRGLTAAVAASIPARRRSRTGRTGHRGTGGRRMGTAVTSPRYQREPAHGDAVGLRPEDPIGPP